MGRAAFIVVMLPLLFEIAAQAGGAKADFQTLSDLKKVKVDIHDWDEEFEGIPTLQVLHDDNFEHDTQAATGQTTGIWLVLFWDPHSLVSRDAEATLKQVITQMKDEPLLTATVNVSSSPRTLKRFNLQKIPLLVLFRDRRMYKYKGHWAAMNIVKFVKDGYQSVLAEEVPKEITYLDHLLETSVLYYHALVTYLANRPGLLAGVGSTLAMCCYLYTRKWLLKRHLEKIGRSRPRKRVD